MRKRFDNWYTRKNLPSTCRDPEQWPQVNPDALEAPDRERFWRFHKVIVAYVSGAPVIETLRACHISRSELLRVFNNCLRLHRDGRIVGWRALVPRARFSPNVRLEPTSRRRDGRGLSGAFSKLLFDYPQIKELIDTLILKRRRGKRQHEVLIQIRHLHEEFIGACIACEIRADEYPRCTSRQGERSLAAYAHRLRREHFSLGAKLLGGEKAASKADADTPEERSIYAERPCDICVLDAHRIDMHGVVLVPTHKGMRRVPLQRFQLLLLVEEFSGAVLAFLVVMRREPTAQDALKTVKLAIEPWTPRKLTLPGLTYPRGAGMPSALIPELRGVCWSLLMLDNASIHWSIAVSDRMRERTGCAVNYGKPRRWIRRPIVESVFSSLERQGFHRLPNSCGTGPEDPLRRNAIQEAVDRCIHWEHLLDVIELVIASHNGKPKKHLQHRSPIEVLQNSLSDPTVAWLPRGLPLLPSVIPDLGVTIEEHFVRGSIENGRRPYVEIDGVHYTNALLARSTALLNKPLAIHLVEDDMRTVRAFLKSGQELGVLVAKGVWGRIRHDRHLRKAINTLMRNGELRLQLGEDPITAFMRCQAEAAVAHSERRAKPKVSQAATELARAQSLTGLPAPTVRLGSRPQPLRASDSATANRPLPSFVKSVTHRTLSR